MFTIAGLSSTFFQKQEGSLKQTVTGVVHHLPFVLFFRPVWVWSLLSFPFFFLHYDFIMCFRLEYYSSDGIACVLSHLIIISPITPDVHCFLEKKIFII